MLGKLRNEKRRAKIMKEDHFRELNDASVKWEEFAGKKNTENTVLKKASALARIMSSILPSAIKEMQQALISENDTIVDDKVWWTVYYDYLLYTIHIADREAFNYLKKTKRHIFIEQLLKEVIEKCLKDFDNNSTANQFRNNFAHNFLLFQKEFSSYQRGKTELLTDNLTYMFAERIQKRLRLGIGVKLHAQIFQFLIVLEMLLNIPCLLNETNN